MRQETEILITPISRNEEGEFVMEELNRAINLGGEHSERAVMLEATINPILQKLKDDADKL